MQAFQKKVDAFERWLEEEEKRLEVHKKTKKPIGIIQSELESFYVSLEREGGREREREREKEREREVEREREREGGSV